MNEIRFRSIILLPTVKKHNLKNIINYHIYTLTIQYFLFIKLFLNVFIFIFQGDLSARDIESKLLSVFFKNNAFTITYLFH